jgi:hypothetical protein
LIDLNGSETMRKGLLVCAFSLLFFAGSAWADGRGEERDSGPRAGRSVPEIDMTSGESAAAILGGMLLLISEKSRSRLLSVRKPSR